METQEGSEFFVPKRLVSVKAEIISELEGARAPFTTFPDKTAIVSVGDSVSVTDGFWRRLKRFVSPECRDFAGKVLARISRVHGRSLVDSRINNKVLWRDTEGHVYGAKVWKGVVMDDPILQLDRQSPFFLKTIGLQDIVCLQREIMSSKYLRENGLPTVFLTKVKEIKEIIEDGKRIPVERWKKRRLAEINQAIKKTGGSEAVEVGRKLLQMVQTYFDKTGFYSVEYDAQVAERLDDLGLVRNWDDFDRLMNPIFKWVNAATSWRKSGIIPGTAQPEKFEFNGEGIECYFAEWLPIQMGTWLARLHNLNVYHGFAHGQNWSAVGTLYDLDLRGEVFGDPALSSAEFVEGTARDTGFSLGALASLTGEEASAPSWLVTRYPDILNRMQQHFIVAYLSERYDQRKLKKLVNDEAMLKNHYHVFFEKVHRRLSNSSRLPALVWESVVKELRGSLNFQG